MIDQDKGSPMPRKTVYICGTYVFFQKQENYENSDFEFGNDHFDSDCGQT